MVASPPPGVAVAGGSRLRLWTVMTLPPVIVTALVGVAGLVSRRAAGLGGLDADRGFRAPLASLRLVMRSWALVIVTLELLVMIRRMVSSPGVPLT